MAEFMSTTRGGRYLILDGYRYTVNRKLDKKTFWRCTEKHICTATVVTNTETDEIENKSKAQHHHAAHDVQINMGKKLLQLRDAMKEQLNQPLKRLYNEAFSTAGSSEAADDQASGSATRTFASLKSSLYRERRKLIQPQLKEEPEEFVLDTAWSETSSEKRFLSANDGSASTSDNVLAYDYEQASKSKVLLAANDFISFINKSPSPFHAVDEVKKKLVAQGFQELLERDSWKIQPLNKYFVTKNQSTIIAFAVGGRYRAGNGFSIVGAHTDSPCLKVKPVSGKVRNGYCQVGVECYGGGIWNTWFDRDLTVAGRVIVKEGTSLTHRLVNLSRPILRIPHLAIHLQREMNDNFGPNKETHLCPILNTCAQAKLQEQAATGDSEETSTESKHPPMLVKMLCDELGVAAEQLIDFELCLADTQPAAIGGALEEFIFSPRLDNLLNAYCACQGLLESLSDGSLEQDPNIRMISLFDNEEVGSNSAQGAGSTFQELVLRRISASGDKLTAFEEAIAKSYMISADQAHAIHPNYAEKHEANHQPAFHKGVVVKFNANQRYATTAITTAILRQVAAQVGVPLQDFVVRNDSPCGSTIGPIMSAKLGMQTIDVGAPQLSMHSIREMGDTTSIVHCTDLFRGFFHLYPSVMDSVKF